MCTTLCLLYPQTGEWGCTYACDVGGAGTGVGFLVALPVTDASGIHAVLYGEAAFSLAILALCVFDHMFFPPLPPSAPSATASIFRAVDTVQDFSRLLTNGNFMVLSLAYGLSLGVYSGWSGVSRIVN